MNVLPLLLLLLLLFLLLSSSFLFLLLALTLARSLFVDFTSGLFVVVVVAAIAI